jgi:hypothetical protein
VPQTLCYETFSVFSSPSPVPATQSSPASLSSKFSQSLLAFLHQFLYIITIHLSQSLEFVATKAGGYHNYLVPLPMYMYEIQSQYHMYSTNINHSHRCSNEAMFTVVQDVLSYKPTVECSGMPQYACMLIVKL